MQTNSRQEFWQKFWNDPKGHIAHKDPQARVGRTRNGVPISSDLWEKTLNSLEQTLQLQSTDHVLDIGSGSGMIAIPFSEKVEKLTAVDYSSSLLKEYPPLPKLHVIQHDILTIDFPQENFDTIICYFTLQHFSENETVDLMEKIYAWLKKGGTAYIGDIPDREKRFTFFHTEEYRRQFFKGLQMQQPIIGTWFDKKFLCALAEYVGFQACEIVEQPEQFINAHYRFDMKCIK